MENTPCAGGIYLRPSIRLIGEIGTTITVTVTPNSSTKGPLLCVMTRANNDGGWSKSMSGAYFKDYGERFVPFHSYTTKYTYKMFCLGPDVAIAPFNLDIANILPDVPTNLTRTSSFGDSMTFGWNKEDGV